MFSANAIRATGSEEGVRSLASSSPPPPATPPPASTPPPPSPQLHATPHVPTLSHVAPVKLIDLPIFSGNVEEWPLFLANFQDSTEDFHYNNRQNLQRLQKCLVGPAREAVSSMLINVQDVPDVIDELKFRFGRPDILVRHQLQKIQRFPIIVDNNQILDFSTQVRNVVAFLRSSNSEHNLNNSSILDELIAKLPQDKQYEWAKHAIARTTHPTIADFSTWLCQIARIVCLMPPSLPSTSKNSGTSRQQPPTHPRRVLHVHENAGSVQQETNGSSTAKCYQCGANHFITKCNVFNSMSVDDRWAKVKTQHLCFSCLRRGHSTSNCRSKRVCGVQNCRRHHHSSLHDESPKNIPAPQSVQPILSCRTTSSMGLLFKIIPITLFGPNGKVEVFAMFDEGSAISIIDEEVSNALGLKGRPQPLTLQWYGENVTTEPSTIVDLEIRGEGESYSFVIKNCRTVRNLSLPVQTFNKCEFKHFEALPMRSYKEVKPVILLGLDNVHLGTSSTIVKSDDHQPLAMKTKLGWVAYGPTSSNSEPSAPVILFIREKRDDDDLHNLVKEYFSADNFGINPSAEILESDDDKTARQIMQETTRRIGNRFETGLLWKSPKPILPNSFRMAEQRFHEVEKKMNLKPDFASRYKSEMLKYIEKGYARKLQQHEIEDESQPVWYLPHFAVQSPHKPDKLRIVFDAAANVNGVSLNSALLKGPERAKPMMSILFKFREGIIGVAADIREMFSQIQIRPQDQHAQRFLWRDGDATQPLCHYVMVSMIFGAVCSPCVAEFIKNLNAQEFQQEYPEAATAIVNKHYVDDYVASFRSEQEATRICKDVVRVNNKGGFDLRNFSSNSAKLQHTMNAKSSECSKTINMEHQATTEKVLGMHWNTSSDTFEFKTKFHRIPTDVLKGVRPPLKRELVGIVMAIYDPYGLLAEFLLYLKILVRDTWKSGITWKEPLTADLNKRWQAWWEEFQKVNIFQIQRCYSPNLLNANSVELHIFMDASQEAFAAAGYFRIIHNHGKDVVFIFGKTRGAPQKTMSIPRLELQAAILGIRLAKIIIRNHDINICKTTYWTDSKTLLHWINSTTRKFKSFVAQRIAQILSSSEPSQWRWVPTNKNSADAATRARNPPKLKVNSVWLTGPEFLTQIETHWPAMTTQPLPDVPDVEEIKSCLCLQVKRGNSLININRFSSYSRLKRTMAYVIRAVNKLRYLAKNKKKKNSTLKRTSNCFLTVAELNKAENILCKEVQYEQYYDEIQMLKSSTPISRKSSIYSLNPYLDEEGLLRIQGRLDEALYLPLQARRPILLPQKHAMSELIMTHYHEKLHHQNSSVILNEARQKFWFPHPKMLLKFIQSKCLRCKMDRATPKPPLMGQLPVDRVTPYIRPFTYTGVDLFGPINVAIGRRREKRWGVIFTCLTVRAAHIELAENLSTDAFILCLRNFINRRGTPVRIRSDNGTNFIGAKRELESEKHLFDVDRIGEEAASWNIEWIFNCPANPSSGGCWERLIRIIKRLMMKILPEEAPRVETLRSVLIEAENIINSRPLTDIPITNEEDDPITPNHFLLGCVNSTQTPYPDEQNICLRKQWKIALNLKDRLWKRWTVEYLPQLFKRPKWHEKVRPLQVHDFVIICDPNQPRSQWRKGRITKVFKAKDEQVRFAEVKTSTGLIKRPASRLAVLTIDGESQGDSRGVEC